MSWLDQLRQLSWQYRAAISVAAGALAYWLLQVVLRKDPNKQRLEASIVGGLAVGILVWFLLLPTDEEQEAASTGLQPQNEYFNVIDPTPGAPWSLPPLTLPAAITPEISIGPISLGYIAPSYQVQSSCGCQERSQIGAQLMDTLWRALQAAGIE